MPRTVHGAERWQTCQTASSTSLPTTSRCFELRDGNLGQPFTQHAATTSPTRRYGDKGRVFGCWSTLLDDPHILMSSAVCQTPTKIVSLIGSELREMMIEDAELGFNLLERLSFLLRDRIQAAYGALEKI